MKRIKNIVSAAMIGIFALSFSGCNMVAKTPQAIAKSPVAKINNVTITRGQLDSNPMYTQQLNMMKAQMPDIEKSEQGKEQIKTLKQQVVDQLVSQEVILQQAKNYNINPDDAKIKDETNKQFEDIKKAFNDDKKFEESLKEAGYTVDSLKENIKDKVIIEKIYEAVTKDITIDDAKAKQYYDQNQLKYTEKPDMIKLAHILVKTEDEAKKVEERLKNGEDFGKLAKELSQDPGSKDNGGEYEVPYVGSNFDPTFMKAAMALKEGQISTPVQTTYGYHVIKTIKKTEYPVKPFDSVKEDIKKTLLEQEKQDKFSKKFDEWKKAAKIETKKYEKNLV